MVFGGSRNMGSMDFGFGAPKKKKKRQISTTQKHILWDTQSHVCYICKKRVTRISEAEFDHVRAYSKGGATNESNIKITHRACNRTKSSKSITATRKSLGFKTKTKKKPAKRKKKPREINPLSMDWNPFGSPAPRKTKRKTTKKKRTVKRKKRTNDPLSMDWDPWA